MGKSDRAGMLSRIGKQISKSVTPDKKGNSEEKDSYSLFIDGLAIRGWAKCGSNITAFHLLQP